MKNRNLRNVFHNLDLKCLISEMSRDFQKLSENRQSATIVSKKGKALTENVFTVIGKETEFPIL